MPERYSYNPGKALSYSKGLFDNLGCGFKFFNGGNLTILSTCFGVQLNFLLGNLSAYPVDDISGFLKGQQDAKTGLFIDASFQMKQTSGFEEEYILWQFTYFTTIALDMLGERPRHPFYFLSGFKDRESLRQWWEKQDFRNFWYLSNKIMFLFYLLTYEQERLGIDNNVPINHFFDLLDSSQDAETGFWGTGGEPGAANRMFGSAHIYMFYDYHKREIPQKEKIITNVLKLQNPDGLFGRRFGGACEDYDAIEIFSVLSKHTDYKSDIVKKSIQKTGDLIQRSQNNNGGFSYYTDNRGIIEKLKDFILQKRHYYRYSGWERMRSNGFNSDLWATYFRVLTIAKIEAILGKSKEDYKFYSLPGWGYY